MTLIFRRELWCQDSPCEEQFYDMGKACTDSLCRNSRKSLWHYTRIEGGPTLTACTSLTLKIYHCLPSSEHKWGDHQNAKILKLLEALKINSVLSASFEGEQSKGHAQLWCGKNVKHNKQQQQQLCVLYWYFSLILSFFVISIHQTTICL